MAQFQSALDFVIERLEQIRDGGGRWPRASRASLTMLHFAPAIRATPRLSKAEMLDEIRARVAVCQKCPHLASTRTQTVFGVGNPDAELMFVGEAPGADEDARANRSSARRDSC